MKINDKVKISSLRDIYDCDGIIIGETKCYWKVEMFNHKIMGKLCKIQKKQIKLFHKYNNLSKGFSKWINVGSFLSMHKGK